MSKNSVMQADPRPIVERIVLCRYCGQPEYYGDMRWHSARCTCRVCYRAEYKASTGKEYAWDDLDGHVPTLEEYEAQEATQHD